MRKSSTRWPLLLLCVFLAFAAVACGTNTPFSNTTAVPTVPPGENIYVLDGYSLQGNSDIGRHIVAFHPGSANPTALISLPSGLTSLDHRTLYTAVPQNGQTVISVINTQTGTTVRSFTIAGTYTTSAYSYDNAVVSSTGQWLALRQYSSATNMTTIAFVDTKAGKRTETINLSGDYTLDAISPGGQALYLLQKLYDTPGHYYVRVYDIGNHQLVDTPIVDKEASNPSGDPNMSGTAITRQMLADGTQAFTLYIDARHNLAFIHVLPLNDQVQPPIARCIDLPTSKDVNLLRYYTLALSKDGSTLYAANGALGVVVNIKLSTNGPLNIYDDQIVSTKHFDPGTVTLSSNDKSRKLYNGAALSPDQNTLYFTGLQGIWAINTEDLSVRNHYLTQQALTGMGLSGDGKTLYAVDPTNGITLVDTASGQAQQVIQGQIHAPWGIEWITD